MALVAVDVLGLSYREAARALRVREATITTRLFRARKQVAAKLADPEADRSATSAPALAPHHESGERGQASESPERRAQRRQEEKRTSGVVPSRDAR